MMSNFESVFSEVTIRLRPEHVGEKFPFTEGVHASLSSNANTRYPQARAQTYPSYAAYDREHREDMKKEHSGRRNRGPSANTPNYEGDTTRTGVQSDRVRSDIRA
jgi:hypothetical protein